MKPFERRLVLISDENHIVDVMDLSSYPNANAQYPLRLRVLQQCSLGHDHILQSVDLKVWGT